MKNKLWGLAILPLYSAFFFVGCAQNNPTISINPTWTEKPTKITVVFTEPFDLSKLEDPSLIIYAAVRQKDNHLVVTNGNQTDTVVEGLKQGKNFYKALEERTFEPDATNFTPRISAELEFDGKSGFAYRMSILKSADAEGSACNRFGYEYSPVPGLGHFIHTYECDGSPLPTFSGEPQRIAIPESIDEFAEEIWNALDEDNKISLYVRYTDLASGETETRLFNKHN